MTFITKEGTERWWAAVQRHADTITLDALIAMTIALGLTLSVEVIELGGDK